jgi:hypothetical protein
MTKSYWASRYMGARRVVAVSNLPDLPASPVPAAPGVTAIAAAPAAPARSIDDDPLGALAHARGAASASPMPIRATAPLAAPPTDDDPIARFATQ